TLLTNSIGALIQGGSLNASTTNGYGLYLNAPTGATNNYAAAFMGGNVGIGTTSPAYALDVANNIRSQGNFISATTSGIYASASQAMIGRNTSGSNIGQFPGIWFGANVSAPSITNYAFLYDDGSKGTIVNTPSNGYIQFRVNNDSTNGLVLDKNKNLVVGGAYNTLANQKLDVLGSAYVSGSVGVGSITPGSLLSVQGTSTSPTLPLLTVASSSGASDLVILANGNVGIGTSTPGQALVVNGQVQITGGSPAQGSVLQSDANGIATWVATSSLGIVGGSTNPGGSSGQVQYNNNGTFAGSAALLANNSVVGVNATSSSYTLNVQGASGVNPFNISSSTGTSLLTVLQNGNVGIGTTSPLAVLHIGLDASSTANSALYTVASTTPVLQLGEKPLSSPSANGTYLGINSPSNFSGDFINIQSGGANRFKVDNIGNMTLNSGAAMSGYTVNVYNISPYTYSGTLNIGANSGNSTISVYSPNWNASNNVNFNLQGHTYAYTGSGSLLVGTTTPIGVLGVQSNSSTIPTLYVQATSSQSSALVNVASSSGSSYFTVLANGNVGIGTTTPNATLHDYGSFAQKYNKLANSVSTYTIATSTDNIIYISTTTVASTINLPACVGSTDQIQYIVKDAGGNAGTNNITVTATAGGTIDGAATKVINSNYGSTKVQCVSSGAWFVLP
ncbi:MAG: hypothetical protein KGJ93_05400, partial [Patescibacteria group bacterium]|nr:hypothetical protein [Patescibacteria group bacterium]